MENFDNIMKKYKLMDTIVNNTEKNKEILKEKILKKLMNKNILFINDKNGNIDCCLISDKKYYIPLDNYEILKKDEKKINSKFEKLTLNENEDCLLSPEEFFERFNFEEIAEIIANSIESLDDMDSYQYFFNLIIKN